MDGSHFNWTDVKDSKNTNDLDFNAQVYPNPVEDRAVIEYSTVENGRVHFTLFDSFGNEIIKDFRSFENLGSLDDNEAGTHYLNIDTKNLPSGMYLLKMNINSNFVVKKVMIIK
jgi:hypothetical protein